MRPLTALDSAAYSELSDLCRIDAARPRSRYEPNGSFVAEPRNGGKDRYWYYRGYERQLDNSPGMATKSFVGRVGDPDIDALASAHAETKASYLARRQIVARLKRVGLPAPQRTEGAVVQVLSEMGLLESAATIVGSAAFQTYGGLLGMRFEQSHYRTQDLDLAQPRGLQIHLDYASASDVLEALKKADATFAPVFHASEPRLVAGFRNAGQFRVEFLTPKTADRAGAGGFAKVAGLSGVGAQQLKFLEFSLKETTTAVMLHEAGLLVPVPDPARFAVHKLIVSVMRGRDQPDTSGKSLKDIQQAQSIIEGLAHIRDAIRLGRAWHGAWVSGPKWRKGLREGTLRLDLRHLSIVADAVAEFAALEGTESPFEPGVDPRSALIDPPRPARRPRG